MSWRAICLAPDSPEYKNLGKYYKSLLEDASWINRRVQTGSFLDVERWEYRISLDINMDKLRERAREFLLSSDKPLPIPLGFRKAELMSDFDIIDAHGSSLQLTESNLNRKLFRSAINAYIDLNFLPGLKKNSFLKSLDSDESKPPAPEDNFTHDDKNIYHVFDEFYLKSYRANSVLSTEIDLSSNECSASIKYRYVSVVKDIAEDLPRGMRLAQALCFEPSAIEMDPLSIARAQSEHIRYVAPEGTTIAEEVLWVDESVHPFPGSMPTMPKTRTMVERIIVYVGDLPMFNGFPYIMLQLQPCASQFFRPALVSLGVNFIILLVLLCSALIYNQGNSVFAKDPFWNVHDSVVFILLFGSTFLQIYSSRHDEHKMSRKLLRWPRAIVLLVAGSTVLAAALFIALGHHRGVLAFWLFTLFASGIVFCYICIIFRRIVRRRKTIEGAMHKSDTPYAVIYGRYTEETMILMPDREEIKPYNFLEQVRSTLTKMSDALTNLSNNLEDRIDKSDMQSD